MADAEMETEDTIAETSPKSNGENHDETPQVNGQTEIINEISDTIEKAEEISAMVKYWTAVKENPQDFTSWTYLLQHTEQQGKLESSREAFDEFFKLYPYCYGYWKKYADLEKKHESLDAAQKIYERGLAAINLSVDLWLHYISFYKSYIEEKKIENANEQIRGVFDQSINAVGKDFKSDKLWETYLSWELDLGEKKNIFSIYSKLLATPTLQYSAHFERFKELVETSKPEELLSEDKLNEIKESLKSKGDAMEEDEDEPKEDDEVEKIKEAIVSNVEEIYKNNEKEVGKRWNYEDGIKRPYFHVKALEKSQLKNWNEYLDFEIEQGDHERIVLLFERCLIACALYEEFWIKYAKYLSKSEKDARAVYKRACLTHLPKKSAVHLAWSAFEESFGNHSEALEILVNLEQALPGLLEVTVRRINLERRRGNHSAVQQLYQHCIDNAPTEQLKSYFSLKFARYYLKVTNEQDKAIELLKTVLEKDKTNAQLYMQLIDIGYQSNPLDESLILETFETAITCPDLSDDVKYLFSQRRMEFQEDFGSDIKTLLKYQDSHRILQENCTGSRKRAGDDSGISEEKKMKTDHDSYNSVATSQTDSAHSYNYNTQASWQNYQNTYGYQQQWNQYQGYYPSA